MEIKCLMLKIPLNLDWKTFKLCSALSEATRNIWNCAVYWYYFSPSLSIYTIINTSPPHPTHTHTTSLTVPMTISGCFWIFTLHQSHGQSATERINRSIVALRMACPSRKLLLLQGSDQWSWQRGRQRPSHSFSEMQAEGNCGKSGAVSTKCDKCGHRRHCEGQ